MALMLSQQDRREVLHRARGSPTSLEPASVLVDVDVLPVVVGLGLDAGLVGLQDSDGACLGQLSKSELQGGLSRGMSKAAVLAALKAITENDDSILRKQQ